MALAFVSVAMPIWPLSAVKIVYDLRVVPKIVEGLTVFMPLFMMRDDRTRNWQSFKRAALFVAGR